MNFQTFNERYCYDRGHSEGYGKGLLVASVWFITIGLIFIFVFRA